MDKKIYIVFNRSSWNNSSVSWNNIDSVWEIEEVAKQRLKDLANEYIEKKWYEEECIPNEDYTEIWNNDSTYVIFEDDYSRYSFYINERKLRSGFTDQYVDLPVFFTVD